MLEHARENANTDQVRRTHVSWNNAIVALFQLSTCFGWVVLQYNTYGNVRADSAQTIFKILIISVSLSRHCTAEDPATQTRTSRERSILLGAGSLYSTASGKRSTKGTDSVQSEGDQGIRRFFVQEAVTMTCVGRDRWREGRNALTEASIQDPCHNHLLMVIPKFIQQMEPDSLLLSAY